MGALARLAPALALTSTAVFAYGLSGPDIGWMSDDHEEVFGASSPVPDWRTAFQIGGDGHWSPYRLLKYPIQGYLGFWLGPSRTHVLQFMGHLFCVLLFYRLLKRLGWPTAAALAAGMLFSSFSWFSEAVYWWPGASANWATVAILLAAHCFIVWTRSARSRWLLAYTCFTLLSLVTYELWLGGFIFFGGLDWYLRRATPSPAESADVRRTWFWRYAGIAAPFLIYAALFFIAPSGAADRIGLTVADLPRSFAVLHVRALEWPLDVQWRWTLLAAEQSFHSTPGALVLAVQATVLALLGVLWVRTARSKADTRAAMAHLRVPVWASFILGWSVLLGSRVALLLVGSVSRVDTRLAYGASIGVAVAGVSLVSGVMQHLGTRARVLAGLLVLAAVPVLGSAAAGVGVHYVRTAAAEAETLRTLGNWLASSVHPRGLTIVVVAARQAVPQGATDLAYFSELNGFWLDYLVKQRCPECETFVVPMVGCVGTRPTIQVNKERETVRAPVTPDGTVTLGDKTVFFRWTGRELIPEKGACPAG